MLNTILSIGWREYAGKNNLKATFVVFVFCVCAVFSLESVSADSSMTVGLYSENKKEIQLYQNYRARFMHSSVFENMGYRLVFINQPYLRNLQHANAGKLDAAIVFKFDKGVDLYESELYLSVSSKPHMASELVLYTKKAMQKLC